MDVLEALRASPLLQGFSADGVRIIAAATSARPVQQGAPIFVDLMHGESAFVIGSGSVELFTGDNVLTEITAPSSFGELGLIRPGPRQIGARAKTDTFLCEIRRKEFLEVQKQRPQACIKLMLNIVGLIAERSQAASPILRKLL